MHSLLIVQEASQNGFSDFDEFSFLHFDLIKIHCLPLRARVSSETRMKKEISDAFGLWRGKSIAKRVH